jgi:hypothetical protein
VTHVRRCRDARDPVGLRCPQNVEAALDRLRTVVDTGQDVRVEIDQRLTPP